MTSLFSPWRSRQGPKKNGSRRGRPVLETLEDRQLLSNTIAEFPLLAGSVAKSGLTSDYMGNMWFAQTRSVDGRSVESIARVASDGKITEFPLPGGRGSSWNVGLTLGYDGNLWFPEDDRIGRISPEGVITEFALPTTGTTSTNLTALTMGSDGNLWFVADRRNGSDHAVSVNRITPEGEITEFPASLVVRADSTLVPGPDESLLFIGGDFAKVAPDGKVTEIALPNDGAPLGVTYDIEGRPWVPYVTSTQDVALTRLETDGSLTNIPVNSVKSLTMGMDGELWFARAEASGRTSFGHIAVDGKVTLLSTTVAGAVLSPGVAGYDGNLWFTMEATASEPPALVRVAVDGTVTGFPVPVAAGATGTTFAAANGLSIGPDGNLWYVNGLSKTVGRIDLELPIYYKFEDGIAYATGMGGGFGRGGFGGGAPSTPMATAAPAVTRVARTGVRRQPTNLSLSFSSPLDARNAANPANYTLVRTGPRGRARANAKPIAIRSAVYDPATMTVTLTTARRLRLDGFYRLTVNGATPSGVKGLGGVMLDGAGKGRPGTDFVVRIHRFGAMTPRLTLTPVPLPTQLGLRTPIGPRAFHPRMR